MLCSPHYTILHIVLKPIPTPSVSPSPFLHPFSSSPCSHLCHPSCTPKLIPCDFFHHTDVSGTTRCNESADLLSCRLVMLACIWFIFIFLYSYSFEFMQPNSNVTPQRTVFALTTFTSATSRTNVRTERHFLWLFLCFRWEVLLHCKKPTSKGLR